MKKLFSLVFVLAFVALLSACQSSDDETKIEDLQSTIQSLESQVETLESNLAQYQVSLEQQTKAFEDLEAYTEELLEYIDALEASIFDGTILVTFESDTVYETHQIHYHEDENLTVLEHLKATFTVDYTESDFGVFINAIGPLNTQHGNFLSISQNGEALMVGIDQVTYENEDHLTFTLTWWDDEAKDYYDKVQLFIDNHKDTFIDNQNEYVLTALSHVQSLEAVEKDMTTEMNPLIKQVLALRAQGVDVESHQTALNDILSFSHPYAASLAVLALYDYEHFDDTEFLALVADEDFQALDLDTLSLIAVALDALNYEGDLLNQIETILVTDAFNHPYGQNSATFANVIIGLISLGVDPRTIEDEGVNLMDTLFEYILDDGSFKYTLSDETADLMFSTPQGFLALVSMQQALNGEAFNPYIIK